MLRRSFTAVIEKNATFTENFATEPYEVGWASEARWFVRVIAISRGASLRLKPQISPDGLFWCAEGSPPIEASKPKLYSLPLRDFGNWLRLDCRLKGKKPSVKLMIYLALKE